MRFYTLQRYEQTYSLDYSNQDESAENADDEWDFDSDFQAQREAEAEYKEYLQTLNGKISPHLLELADLRGVDDGLIVEVHFIRSLSELVFVLRCGDSIMGYYDLVLRYRGATLTPEHERTLVRLARAEARYKVRSPFTGRMRCGQRKSLNYLQYEPDLYRYELVFHEDSGEWEHGFLFHPGVSFSVRCQSLEWERIERPNRDLPALSDRFPGGVPARS